MMKVLLVLCIVYALGNAQEIAKGEHIREVINHLDTLISTVSDLEQNHTKFIDNYEDILTHSQKELHVNNTLRLWTKNLIAEILTLAKEDHQEHCREYAVKSIYTHLQHALLEMSNCTNKFTLNVDTIQSQATSIIYKAKDLALKLKSIKDSLILINSVGLTDCLRQVFSQFDGIIQEIANSKEANNNETEAVNKYNNCLDEVHKTFSRSLDVTKSDALVCIQFHNKIQLEISLKARPDTEGATSLPDFITDKPDLSDGTTAAI